MGATYIQCFLGNRYIYHVYGWGQKGFGYYNIIPDSDGSVRWNQLVIRYKDKYYAPLSMQALKVYLGAPPLSLALTDYGVASIGLGEISIPVDESGRLLINYYGRMFFKCGN